MEAERVIRCQTPAKVNLSLAVLARRLDGFHEIESSVIAIEWFDELELSPADDLAFSLTGSTADIPDDDRNLVVQAARALAHAAGHPPHVSIRLAKRIPVGAGLGGGSSDAAATLHCLNDFWNLNWPIERLSSIAARLGSDVPFFLNPGPAMIRGRGEQVEPLSAAWARWLAIVVPPYGLATAQVYRLWDESPHPSSPRRFVCPDPSLSAVELSSRLFNDLEAAAFAGEPRLKDLHLLLERSGDRPVRMTGSGSCLFALFDSPGEGAAWKQRISTHLDDGTVIQVVRATHGRR